MTERNYASGIIHGGKVRCEGIMYVRMLPKGMRMLLQLTSIDLPATDSINRHPVSVVPKNPIDMMKIQEWISKSEAMVCGATS